MFNIYFANIYLFICLFIHYLFVRTITHNQVIGWLSKIKAHRSYYLIFCCVRILPCLSLNNLHLPSVCHTTGNFWVFASKPCLHDLKSYCLPESFAGTLQCQTIWKSSVLITAWSSLFVFLPVFNNFAKWLRSAAFEMAVEWLEFAFMGNNRIFTLHPYSPDFNWPKANIPICHASQFNACKLWTRERTCATNKMCSTHW